MRCIPNRLVPVITLLSAVAGVTALAQMPTYKLGRPPSQEEIRAWDIAMGPAGNELPPGSGTAKEGAKIFAQKCALCHGPDGTAVPALMSPLARGTRGRSLPFVGGIGTLNTPGRVKSVGSYWPYATTIWDFINRTMPWKNEGTLSADEVYALTAFILYKNGIIQESDVMDAKSLPKIQMPNRNGFLPRVEDIRRWRCPVGTCP